MVMWTEEQLKAIEARNSNLLVAAAAGSGKTAVLVERILQIIIKDQIDIDRLLIVTFTNAAAGEMRERISAALLNEMEKSTENKEHLRKQMNLLGKSSISTLHSFCIDVVRKHFHLIDINPNFRVGEPTETSIMKIEALEEIFEEAYKNEEEAFFGLVERFGGNSEDTPLQELVLSLYEFIQSKPYPRAWLRERIEDFKLKPEEFDHNPWKKAIEEQLFIQLDGAKTAFVSAKELCQKAGGPEGYLEAIKDDVLQTEELILALETSLDEFYAKLKNITHKRLGRLSKDVVEELKEQVKELREQGKELIKEIQTKILFKSPMEYIKDMNELYPYMDYLYKLICSFEDAFRDKKLEKGILDFNDLEHYTLSILDHEAVARMVQEKYDYIFVDEYQDSNVVQETILGYIKRKNNLFMVGDVKQSIYRFRLADPSLFIEKYESYGAHEENENRRIDLGKNFRSREEILHGVNFIFKNIMNKYLGEIDYDERAYLYKGADFEPISDPSIEINLIEKNRGSEELEEELEELEDMEAEARAAAQRIKALLQEEIYDTKEKKYRKITYKDMVVLLRSTKNWAQAFLEAFIEEGIPAYADVNSGYFEATEVNIFVNLLKLIDNKRQDIPLLSVMRSPIGGFTTKEMIQIRTYSKAHTYYEAVMEYVEAVEDELKDKLIVFLNKLFQWKEQARYMNIDQLIWRLFMDTGYYYYVGAMPGGIQRQANLRVLGDRARQFQTTTMKGLFHFIKFMDKLKDSSGDMGTAKILGENEDVVRIMSIHKSKGLEFPVVIIGGMGKQFNLSDTNAQVLFHKDLGVGPKYADPELRQYTDTIAKIAMKNKIKLENLSEEMRILYVALTRAKDKLILMGSVKNVEQSCKKWMKPLNILHLSRAKNYLDWICPVLARHKDGESIRESSGIEWQENMLLKDLSKWRVHILSKAEMKTEQMEKQFTKMALKQYLKNLEKMEEPEDSYKIKQRLNWKYEHSAAVSIPSKLSVTDIKKLSTKKLESGGMNIPALVKMPRFMEGKKQLTGIEKGIAMHFVMQHLDLKRVNTEEEIHKQVLEMVSKELLKPEEAEALDKQKIVTFFNSKIGQRILKANKVFREVPFNLARKAYEIIPELEDCKENMLIQGVIDCYFEENEEYILVDYKTDYISFETKQELIENYRIQLELYKMAIEAITKKPVKESYLYLFYIDEEVKL